MHAHNKGFTVTPFHLNIIRALCNDDPFGLILAPRGFGKTEVVNSWLCVVGLRNRNIRILVTSRTDNQIKSIGNNIRKTYTSEAFTRIFGDVVGDKWNESEFSLSGRNDMIKEAAFSCYSAGNAIISKHFDIIIGDDLVVESDRFKPTERLKLESWYDMALLPTLVADGRVTLIGTPYHMSDLYSKLIAKGQYKVYRSLALIRDRHTNELVSSCELVFPTKKLLQRRDSISARAFALGYQMDYNVEQAKFFNPNDMRYFKRYEYIDNKIYVVKTNEEGTEEKVRIRRTFLGIDLAVAVNDDADYFVIAVGGVDIDNNLYILDIFRTKLLQDEQFAAIQSFAKEYNPYKIGIEANGVQGGLGLLLRDRTNLPIELINTNKDKEFRATIFSPRMKMGEIWFNETMPSLHLVKCTLNTIYLM